MKEEIKKDEVVEQKKVNIEIGTMLDYESPMHGMLSHGVDLARFTVRGVTKKNLLRRKQQGWVENGNIYEDMIGMNMPIELFEKRQQKKQDWQDNLLRSEEKSRQESLRPKQNQRAR